MVTDLKTIDEQEVIVNELNRADIALETGFKQNITSLKFTKK